MASGKNRENTIVVEAKVKPSSKEEKIEYSDGLLKIWVKEPADKDKANKSLIKLLKRAYGDCEIASGHRSRKKFIRFKGLKSPL